MFSGVLRTRNILLVYPDTTVASLDTRGRISNNEIVQLTLSIHLNLRTSCASISSGLMKSAKSPPIAPCCFPRRQQQRRQKRAKEKNRDEPPGGGQHIHAHVCYAPV